MKFEILLWNTDNNLLAYFNYMKIGSYIGLFSQKKYKKEHRMEKHICSVNIYKLNYYLLGKWLLRDALVDAAAGESDREKTQTGHSKCEQKTYHLYIHYVQISSINNQTNLPSFIQPWGGARDTNLVREFPHTTQPSDRAREGCACLPVYAFGTVLSMRTEAYIQIQHWVHSEGGVARSDRT